MAKKEKIIDYISNQEINAAPEEIEATQIFSKKLVNEYGYDKEQIQTRPQFRIKDSPSGKKKYPLDIAVFKNEKRLFDDIFLIVECKRNTRTDGIGQLKDYMGLCNAIIGIWFNGLEHAYLLKKFEDGQPVYHEIPNIPRKNQRLADIGKHKRSDLRKPTNLKNTFNDMRNHLAGTMTGTTRDESIAQEIINILFCKIYDEINTKHDDAVEFRAGINESPDNIKIRITDLFEKVKNEYSDLFTNKDVIDMDSVSLMYVIGELENFAIMDADRDAIGDAFEVFISPSLRGGDGQFFTPRNVIKMIVGLLNPKSSELIIDPACGSGGFLITALGHVWSILEEKKKSHKWSEARLEKQKQTVAEKNFRGIDKDAFLARVTKIFMAIVGDGQGGIFCENALKVPTTWTTVNNAIKLNSFDIVITNPPFGAKIQVKGKEIMEQYEMGHKWNGLNKTDDYISKLPPQILFLERCIQLLKPNGRAGIVVPDGILGNLTTAYVRKTILSQARLIGVVDLPLETFQPYTQTKTSVIILQKKTDLSNDNDNYKIFMGIAKKCGHDRRGRPISDDDLPKMINEFESFRGKYNIDF